MSEINIEKLEKYLKKLYHTDIEITSIKPLGRMEEVEFVLKDYGYGTPLRIDFSSKGESKTVVFGTIKPGGFGHNEMSDRAAILFRQNESFNNLPQHVKSIDIGGITTDNSFRSLGDVKELFILTDLVEGREYFRDLDRIKATGEATELDYERVKALAKYLVMINSVKKDDPEYYERRTRELIGHNECIFGLTDSYPMNHDWIKPKFLAEIEKKCIDWRWRNKKLTHRLSQVHGDFHPFNILFKEGIEFTVLDRSRGSYGEPADDLAGLSINYLFWGLLHKEKFTDPFKKMWETFYVTYLESSKDYEVLNVIPPYLSWRALVVASPVWYPHINIKIREMLLNFASNILDNRRFDWRKISPLLRD
jgi:hypothetical protein